MKAAFVLLYPEELLRVNRILTRSELELLVVCICLLRWGNHGTFSIPDLMKATGRSRSSVYRKMARLRGEGLIKGRGGDWVVSPRLCMKGRLSRADQVEESFEHFGRVPSNLLARLGRRATITDQNPGQVVPETSD